MRKIVFLASLVSFLAVAEVPLNIVKISNNVYALEGETSQRSKDNLGNNSTHGVIIGKKSVLLIDSGASFLGAKQIHNTIKSITNKPIKYVINTGGQDHRWLGNDYFHKLGASIIASEKTYNDQIARTDQQLNRLGSLIGKSLNGTKPFYANQTFKKKKILDFGGIHLELYHFGSAHTIGDIMVWMPSEKIMFSGDIVFVNRMLGIGPAKNINSWIKVFENMKSFNPKVIVPGHGHVADLKTATTDTYDYLVFLRNKVRAVIEDDGNMLSATNINQDKFRYLKNFKDIAKKNAQNVFIQLEFE